MEALAREGIPYCAGRAVGERRLVVGGGGGPRFAGGGVVRQVAVAGGMLATSGCDGTVRLWSVPGGDYLGVLRCERTRHTLTNAVAFGADGGVLAQVVGFPAVVRVWDVVGRRLAERQPPGDEVRGRPAVSPDGRYVAVGSGAAVLVWDLLEGRLVGRWPVGDGALVRAVAFGSEGGWLAAATGPPWTVHQLDPVEGRLAGEPLRDLPAAAHLTAAPGGRLLTWNTGRSAIVACELAAGRITWTLPAGEAGLLSEVAVTPDGQSLAVVGGGPLIVYRDLTTGEPAEDLATGSATESGSEAGEVGGEADGISHLAFGVGGRLVVTARWNQVRVGEPGTGRSGSVLVSGHADRLADLRYSPDGRLLAGRGAAGGVWLWDPRTGRPVGSPIARDPGRPLRSPATAMAFAPAGGMLAVGYGDGEIEVRDTATGVVRHVVPTGQRWIDALAFAPDGRLCGTGRDGFFRIHDPVGGRATQLVATELPGPFHALAFDPAGRLLVVASPRGLRAWWTEDWRPCHRFTDPERLCGTRALAFSPDGGLLGVDCPTGDGFRLLDTATGRDIVVGAAIDPDAVGVELEAAGAVSGMAFSPDGALLATGGGGGVRLWHAATGRAVGPPLSAGVDGGVALGFSPDGAVLASSAALECAIRLWDVRSGGLVDGTDRVAPG